MSEQRTEDAMSIVCSIVWCGLRLRCGPCTGRANINTREHTQTHIQSEDVVLQTQAYRLDSISSSCDVLCECVRVFLVLTATIEKWASNGLL